MAKVAVDGPSADPATARFAPASAPTAFPPEIGAGAAVPGPEVASRVSSRTEARAERHQAREARRETREAHRRERSDGASEVDRGGGKEHGGESEIEPKGVDEPATASEAELDLGPPKSPEVRMVDLAPQGQAQATPAERSPEAPTDPAPSPVADGPLPPETVRDDVRIRIDDDLEIRVAPHGTTVDVRLSGDPDTVRGLLGIGPELSDSLAGSGFGLGQFGAEDQAPEHRQDPEAPRPERSRVPTARSWRAGRYA